MQATRQARDVTGLLWSLLLAGLLAFGVVYVASRTTTSPAQASPRSEGALYVQMTSPETGVAIYRMPSGSRIRDLFRVARVPQPQGLDGATPLEPGRAVTVDADGGASTGWMPGDRMVALGVAIPLNECSLQDLVAIPGIGQATALKILQGRLERGRYESLNQLADLPGVGAKTVSVLRQYGRI